MGRLKRVLRVGYSSLKYQISKDDIDAGTFETLLSRRKIQESVVKRLFKRLVNGGHFESPFVVNKKNGRFRLIDGNHRYEGIVRYINANPKNRVEVVLNIYEGLDEQEEKKLFTAWNLGRKQSTNDVVQQYKDEIPIFKKITNSRRFPCGVTVYGGANAISFYKLVGAYIAGTEPTFHGGFIGTPWDFVDRCKTLGNKDVHLMSVFMTEFMRAFGPIRNNKFLRTTPFTAVMRIWLDNKNNFYPYTRMIHWFKLKLANDARAIDLGSMSGRGACVYVREQYVRMLNNNRTRELFVMTP